MLGWVIVVIRLSSVPTWSDDGAKFDLEEGESEPEVVLGVSGGKSPATYCLASGGATL